MKNILIFIFFTSIQRLSSENLKNDFSDEYLFIRRIGIEKLIEFEVLKERSNIKITNSGLIEPRLRSGNSYEILNGERIVASEMSPFAGEIASLLYHKKINKNNIRSWKKSDKLFVRKFWSLVNYRYKLLNEQMSDVDRTPQANQ